MINAKKNLYRLLKQGQISGVCAGLADYIDIDVTLMRVIWAVSAFITSGATILLYIILAIVMPASDEEVIIKSKASKAAEANESFGEKMQDIGKNIQSNASSGRLRNLVGLCLMLFGVWLLITQFFPAWTALFRWDFVWPIILIVVGVIVIVKRK